MSLQKRIIRAVAAASACLVLFTSAGVSVKTPEEVIVRQLVSQRNEAMSRYFASEISCWEAGQELREVETGRLLEEETASLREYFRTDIDQVMVFEIREVDFSYISEDLLCAVVQIRWETAGLEGEECFTEDYSVICEKVGNSFKLVQFF